MNFNDEGVPIAHEKYKSNYLAKHNRVLYFCEDSKNPEKLTEDDISDEQLYSIFGKHKMRSLKARSNGRKALIKLDKSHHDKTFNEVKLSGKSQFFPIPYSLGYDKDDSEARDVYFLNGPSGSGKSHFSAMLINVYRAFGYKVFIITDVEDKKFGNATYLNINDFVDQNESFEDDKKQFEEAKIKFKYAKKQYKKDPNTLMKMELALNDLKPSQENKNKLKLKFSENQMEKLFSKCVVLFDDYENNVDIDKIEYLRNHLLTKGRHWKCNLIICNHQGNAGASFKLIKIETTNYVVFKKGTSHERNYLLSKYVGMDKVNIKRVSLALEKSRWVSINVTAGYVLTENEAYSLI